MTTEQKPPSFFASEEVETFELEAGYWVELKRELDFGEESELESAAIKSGIDERGRPQMEYSLKNLRSLKLALYVVDWNLPSPKGKPVELPTSIARRQDVFNHLAPKWARKISNRIDAIRAEQGAVDAITLAGLDENEVNENPTLPGAEPEIEPPSSSVNGGAAPTELSNVRPLVSSTAPSS